jgi:hypothetical protein
MAYVEVAQDMSKAGGQPAATGPEQPAEPAAEEKAKPAESISAPPSSESESKKKFTKSYGS